MTFYSAHPGRWYSKARLRTPFFHHAIFLDIFQHDKARQTISCYRLILDSILSDLFYHVKVLCSLATSTILNNYRFYETNILDRTDIPLKLFKDLYSRVSLRNYAVSLGRCQSQLYRCLCCTGVSK